MTTPSGQISLSQVNTELGVSPASTLITMNQANVRSLAGVPTGAITMANLQNKSNTFNATISSPQTNLDLITYLTPLGYTPGGNASIIIAPGVTISATTTGNVGLTIPSAFGAGKLTLTNNGQIFGKGGDGANTAAPLGFYNGSAGGNAMSISTPITLTNNSFIAGGGGGGAGSVNTNSGISAGGGGGAGGGAGGTVPSPPNGQAGGSGGTSFPGTGGAGVPSPSGTGVPSNPGPGGGGGGHRAIIQPIPPNTLFRLVNAGGGGGWGAAGGQAITASQFNAGFGTGSSGAGGSSNAAGGTATTSLTPASTGGSGGGGGKAINLNGNVITYPATGTIWGTVS